MVFKLIIFSLISIVYQIFSPNDALAWGAGIHVVTALSSLNETALLLPTIVRVITAYPAEYLYGCLTADFFIGKSKRKKASHPHNWEGGFRLLAKAQEENEASYAYGFLSHLAADVVAHNIFVPNLIAGCSPWRRKGHLYWEMKADYSVGPVYVKIARDILSMDHRECDYLLKIITGKVKKGVRAKKRLYTQSVKFYDYLYTNHDPLFARIGDRQFFFNEYLSLMVSLSCNLVNDFLKHPDSARCLSLDPMGKYNLLSAKKRSVQSRAFNTRRHNRAIQI
ncbi:zinc dependent phospholipase C family protein [Thermodesulfobacteriota bacterium]